MTEILQLYFRDTTPFCAVENCTIRTEPEIPAVRRGRHPHMLCTADGYATDKFAHFCHAGITLATSQRRHLRICPAVLFENPHNVFGNGDRHDGKRDGENCLFEDAHAENGSMASRRSLAKLSSLHGSALRFLGRACVPTPATRFPPRPRISSEMLGRPSS